MAWTSLAPELLCFRRVVSLYIHNIVWHCFAEIGKIFPNDDVVHKAAWICSCCLTLTCVQVLIPDAWWSLSSLAPKIQHPRFQKYFKYGSAHRTPPENTFFPLPWQDLTSIFFRCSNKPRFSDTGFQRDLSSEAPKCFLKIFLNFLICSFLLQSFIQILWILQWYIASEIPLVKEIISKNWSNMCWCESYSSCYKGIKVRQIYSASVDFVNQLLFHAGSSLVKGRK